jgi:hypothetical protein
MCKLLQRFPDVAKGTPMIPARIAWKEEGGGDYTLRDEKGLPVMVPAYDPALEDFVERHHHGLEDKAFTHGGVIEVWAVDQKTWQSVDVVQQIQNRLHDVTASWYEDRDFYREGAVECYNAHGNPDLSSGCPDYLSDSKIIGKGRYEDDDGHTHVIPDRHRQYLCHLCPYVHAYVIPEIRHRKGVDR